MRSAVHDLRPRLDDLAAEQATARRSPRCGLSSQFAITAAAILSCFVIFLVDVQTPLGFATGVLYLVPVALARESDRAGAVWLVVATAAVLTIFGTMYSRPPAIDSWVANRILAAALLLGAAGKLTMDIRTERELRRLAELDPEGGSP